MNDMSPKLKIFKNGLRLVVIPNKEAPTVTALVLVAAGSKYESERQHGLSHFLEHMYFKGTEKYPTAHDIAVSFDKIGAISNAFTSQEYTGYYAKGSPKHLSTFIDILSDIYMNSIFPEAEIVKERGVIVEEINMYEDMPQAIVAGELFSLMYPDQAVGRTIIGTKESILQFERSDFLQYRNKYYTAKNTVVVISGNIPEATISQIRTSFAKLESGTPNKKSKVRTTQKDLGIKVRYKETDQAHLALGFHSVPLGHPALPVASLLATILGRGMSSRLFLKLREEMGAVYHVHAEQDTYTDHGVLGIFAGIDKSRLREIIIAIVSELELIKKVLIAPEELAKAKEFALGMLRLGLESSDDLAGFYGAPIVLGQPFRTPAQIARQYGAVTAEDMRTFARKILQKKNVNLALVGPFMSTDIDAGWFDIL